MRCLSCKYSLQNLTEPRCPECGQAFDPNDPKTFDTPSSLLRRKLFLALWLVILPSAIAYVFWLNTDWTYYTYINGDENRLGPLPKLNGWLQFVMSAAAGAVVTAGISFIVLAARGRFRRSSGQS